MADGTGREGAPQKNRLLPEEWVCAVTLLAMVALVAVQVVGRYVLHSSISYTEELVRYLFVWITFLGIAAGTARRRHLSIAGALRVVPARYRLIVQRITGTAAFLFTAAVTVYGIKVVMLQIRTGQTTAALGAPMWIVGAVIPAGGLLILVRLLGLLRAGKGNGA